jgi:hypothetical protein
MLRLSSSQFVLTGRFRTFEKTLVCRRRARTPLGQRPRNEGAPPHPFASTTTRSSVNWTPVASIGVGAVELLVMVTVVATTSPGSTTPSKSLSVARIVVYVVLKVSLAIFSGPSGWLITDRRARA